MAEKYPFKEIEPKWYLAALAVAFDYCGDDAEAEGRGSITLAIL